MRCRVMLATLALVGCLLPLSLNSGQLRISHANALDGSWTTYLYMNNISDLEVTRDGVWCAARGGALFYDFDASEFTIWNRSRDGLISDTLSSVVQMADGRIAFGSAGMGLSVYSPENGLWYNYNSSVWPLAGNDIRFIREDDSWRLIGTSDGFTAFENGEQRKICQQGLDICDLAGWVIKAGLYFDGWLWLGAWADDESGAGVSRYNYDNPNHDPGIWEAVNTGLPDLNVSEIAVWQDTLFCANDSGVTFWNGAAWEGRTSGLPEEMRITDITSGEAGLYLAASGNAEGGIFLLTIGATEWIRLGEERFYAECVQEGQDGIVWAGMSAGSAIGYDVKDGLWEYVGGTWIQHRLDSPHPSAYYRTLSLASGGDLWAATSGGGWRILHLKQGRWSYMDEENTLLTNAWVFDLRVDGDHLWVGHCCCSSPPTHCQVDYWALDDSEINIVSGVFNVYDSTQDDWGNFWFGSYHEGYGDHPDRANGIHYYNKTTETWSNHTVESTGGRIRSDAIPAIEAEGEYLWIGYLDQGVTRVKLAADGSLPTDFSAWTQYEPGSTANPLVGDRITAIATRPDEVWIGTNSGVSIYRRQGGTGRWSSYRAAAGQLPANGVIDIALTRDNSWIAVDGAGVTRMHREPDDNYTFTTFTSPDLVNANVTALASSLDSEELWVGTLAGLSLFRERTSLTGEEISDLNLYPNPFNPACNEPIRFQNLPGVTSGGVIVDVSGHIIRRIEKGLAMDDPFWDGRDESGEPVAPGLYIVRVSTPQGWLSGKVAVLDLLPCD